MTEAQFVKHWPAAMEVLGYGMWLSVKASDLLYRPALRTAEESTQTALMGMALLLGEFAFLVAAGMNWHRWAHGTQPRWRAVIPTAMAALPFLVVAVRDLARAWVRGG